MLSGGSASPDLVAELVGLPVDILVVGSSPAAVAAKQATQAIPIVFLGGGDPVRSGLRRALHGRVEI